MVLLGIGFLICLFIMFYISVSDLVFELKNESKSHFEAIFGNLYISSLSLLCAFIVVGIFLTK